MTDWYGQILSEIDHRLNRVQDWASKGLEILRDSLGVELETLEISDVRLVLGVDMLSSNERLVAFVAALNRRTIRVYDLR